MEDTNIELIQKLFAKASGAGTTEEEAQAFMKKVHELLARHNLDLAKVLKQTNEVQEPVDSEGFRVILPTSWFGSLALATAKMYFCSAYVNNRKKTYYFVGRKNNRTTAMNMFGYFMKTITRLANQKYTDQANRYQFSKGCALRLTSRIYEEIKKAQAPVNNVSGLPALYDSESKAVTDYLASKDLVKHRKVKAIALTNALGEGYNAANNISFNNQVGGNKSDTKRLT
jgi:hypothetical protein